MNKNIDFEAFGVIFCPAVCSYFCLVYGGGGCHCRILKTIPPPPKKKKRYVIIGDRQSRTTPTKDLLHRVVFFGGWCANCRKLRKRQTTHHPQFCTRDVDCRFCGGGAWISRSEIIVSPMVIAIAGVCQSQLAIAKPISVLRCRDLQSPWPGTGVLNWEIPGSAPGSAPGGALGNWGARGVLQRVLKETGRAPGSALEGANVGGSTGRAPSGALLEHLRFP